MPSITPTSPTRTAVRAAAAPPPARALPPLAVGIAAALLTVLLAAAPAALAQEDARDRVTVPGVGTVYGEPDRATLELGVEATGSDARSVIDDTSERMEALQRVLAEYGIAERDVRTVVFDLFREEPYDRDGEPLPVRYRLIHLVEVTVRDVDAVGDVLAAAVESGADRIGGVRFGMSDRSTLEERARAQAFEDARSKARALADAAGRTLGPALRIEEGTRGPGPVPESRAMALGGDDVPIAEGQLAVRVSVTVAFALE